jgi:hypothetical protein
VPLRCCEAALMLEKGQRTPDGAPFVDRTLSLYRWAARITGFLLVGLVVLMMIGEGGPPNILTQPPPVQVESVGMLLMLAGFLLGW